MDIRKNLLTRCTKILDGPMSLDKAILVAVLAHAGQEDKGRNSYIRHPLRVMEKLNSEYEMAIAVCHDVVEDTDITLEDLTELGFTLDQVKALDALTKRSGEVYSDAIERVQQSYVAIKVKIQDIMDNSQLWRLKNRKLTEKDMIRQQHYIDALTVLGGLVK